MHLLRTFSCRFNPHFDALQSVYRRRMAYVGSTLLSKGSVIVEFKQNQPFSVQTQQSVDPLMKRIDGTDQEQTVSIVRAGDLARKYFCDNNILDDLTEHGVQLIAKDSAMLCCANVAYLLGFELKKLTTNCEFLLDIKLIPILSQKIRSGPLRE